MQMNGFSIQEMGCFSCFRTMFLRHDLPNFIPRERGGGGGGWVRYSGEDKVLYGEALA